MTAPSATETDAALQMLQQLPGSQTLLDIRPILGGRNNRVWKATTSQGAYLLKQYFTHPSDTRDRLARETEFLSAARGLGCDQVPRCVAIDANSRYALLEWIEGVVPTFETIDPAAIDQAAAFIVLLNSKRDRCPVSLQAASEACFIPSDHLQLVEKRIERLEGLACGDELDREMIAFVRDEVRPVWERAAGRIARLSKAISKEDRCLSPSDFGFHNSLRESSGRLRFVDFEYAGWDDPAKLICDFANQPDMILPVSLSDRFRQAVTTLFPNPAALIARTHLLEPVLQVKWTCICLNLFLSAGRDRARFTDRAEAHSDIPRRNQLARARMMLDRARNTL